MEIRKDLSYYAARVISYIFQPMIFGLTMFVLVATKYNISDLRYVFAVLVGAVVITIYILITVFIKKSTDFEFSDVKSRPPFLAAGLAGVLIGYAMTLFVPELHIASYIFRNVVIVLAITLMISFYWKISLHSTFTTAFICFIAANFSMLMAFLLTPILPAVCWARIRLHKHTQLQLIAGICLGLVMIFT